MTRLYRKGDIVNVRAVITVDEHPRDGLVTHDDRGPMVRVKPDGYYDTIFVAKGGVELVIPHFNMGDRVGFKLENEEPSPLGVVKAVVDGYVWVKLDNGAMQTFPAKDTVLLENEQVTA